MSKAFEINIGTRKIKVMPGEDVQVAGGELTGTFSLSENDASSGAIRFDQQAWENQDTGNLSYIELEAVAEDILFRYQ